MRRFHIYIGFIVWLLTSLFAVSCNDELEGNGYSFNSSSNLQVLVPLVHSNGTRAGESDPAENLTYNATEEECRINSLRLFAFPIDGKGTLLNEYLGAPGTSFYEPGNFEGGVDVATYTLRIDPGTYRIYVVANMEDVLKGQTIDTEYKLKKVVLNYLPEGKPGMPACGNIPMIYEPLKDTNITSDSKTTDIVANLKFTCVKVKLNLLFDPADSEMQEALKTNGLKINDITANNLSQSTSLVWGGKFYASDKEDVSGIIGPKIMYKQSSEASAAGSFFSDWTRDDTNKNKSNADVITAVGTAAAAPSIIKDKWLFQGTYYLPERYIKTNDQQSFLTLSSMIGANDNSYNIPLGHTDNPEKPRRFPRGTYYEIIGKIKSLGNMTLNCNVSVEDWTPVTIDADFSHTTLWVNKTKANVTSMKNDYITYNSNAGTVGFGCDTKISSKDIIIGTKRGKDANGNDSIEFRVNPNIPISAYAENQLKGTAKFWLQANNLKKYIDVDYDVTPYLDVTKELVIYYNKDDKSQNIRNIKWDTNLGGIVLDRITDTKGYSTIKMSLASSNAATGTFTVTAEHDPETTTIHEFKVTSKDDVSKSQTVRVTVSPPIGDYRIYFRAINDRNKYKGGSGSDNFKGILAEGGTNNWSDGWNSDANDTSDPITSNHCIYVYTQIGETEDAVTGKGWLFTKGPMTDNRNGWPGEEMVADMTNTGWYYKDFAQNAQSIINTNESEGKRTITPGETLIMFSNNTYQDQGYSLHRCPHHLEPGIPLFDYEDREGWIVYDPTSDPIWRVHDDMPEIENIEFKVYTQFELFGWYKVYGIAGSGQFTIWDTDAKNSWKCEKVGKDWYKTTIKLKAVKGEHEKNILLKKENNDNSPTITLFDGNSYEKYGDTGYYQGDKWHQGTPNELNK